MSNTVTNTTNNVPSLLAEVDTLALEGRGLYGTEATAVDAASTASTALSSARGAVQAYNVKAWWHIHTNGGVSSAALNAVLASKGLIETKASEPYRLHVQAYQDFDISGVNDDNVKKALNTRIDRVNAFWVALDYYAKNLPAAFASEKAVTEWVGRNQGMGGVVKMLAAETAPAKPEIDREELDRRFESATIKMPAPREIASGSEGVGFFRLDGDVMRFVPMRSTAKLMGSLMGNLPSPISNLPSDLNFMGEMFTLGEAICPSGLSDIPVEAPEEGDEINASTPMEPALTAFIFDPTHVHFSIAQTRSVYSLIVEATPKADFSGLANLAKDICYIQGRGYNLYADEIAGQSSRLRYAPKVAGDPALKFATDSNGVPEIQMKRKLDGGKPQNVKLRLVGLDQFTMVKPRWTWTCQTAAYDAQCTIEGEEMAKFQNGFVKAGSSRNEKERVLVSIKDSRVEFTRGKAKAAAHVGSGGGTAQITVAGVDLRVALAGVLAMNPESLDFDIDTSGILAIYFETEVGSYAVLIPGLDPDHKTHDVRLKPFNRIQRP